MYFRITVIFTESKNIKIENVNFGGKKAAIAAILDFYLYSIICDFWPKIRDKSTKTKNKTVIHRKNTATK
jgi:hypothetical protein